MRPIAVLSSVGFGLLVLLPVAAGLAADSPTVVTRQQWGAKPLTKEIPRHRPMRLTVHHTATTAKPGASLQSKLRSLQAFSQSDSKLADGRTKKAWGDLPYHFYIDVNGMVGEGRAVELVGDTNTKYDPTGHISVVLEGNFERETPTAAQIDALVALLAALAERYAIDIESIGAHKQFAQTACPGKNLLALLPSIVAAVSKQRAQAR